MQRLMEDGRHAKSLCWQVVGHVEGLLADGIQGNGLNVVKVMPESAIKFGSYEVAHFLFTRVINES